MKVSNAPAKGKGRDTGIGSLGNNDGREQGVMAPMKNPAKVSMTPVDPNQGVGKLDGGRKGAE